MTSQDLRLGFDSDLTIRHAAHLKDVVASALQARQDVRVAINPDAAVDLSLVQLISSARLHAQRAGGSLSLAAPAGSKLRDVLARAGFIEGASSQDLEFWLHSENAQ